VPDPVTVAVPIVGAPGTPHVVTLPLGVDGALVPTILVAVTVNVYAVLFESPVTLIGELAPVAVIPPGDEVTV